MPTTPDLPASLAIGLHYLRADGTINFRACLALARRERRLTRKADSKLPAHIQVRIAAWSASRKARSIGHTVRATVSGEETIWGWRAMDLGLIPDTRRPLTREEMRDTADSFEQVRHNHRRFGRAA